MTLTLLVLAMVAAANPFRAAAARAPHTTHRLVGVAVAATLVLVLLAAMLSGPLLDLVDVSGPNARIAGGIALLVVALKDTFATPPAPEPALAGLAGGLIPMAFPVLFSPALAVLAIAGASERGVVVTLLAAALALIPAAVILVSGTRPRRMWLSTAGVFGAGIAALVVLDGVYAI